MGINNLVRGRGFRNFMAKLYGWGASVVILGALFKINHYPGADYMLIVGLGTEAIIFFFSAFEPPHVEPDWSLVYPELAGMYHGSDDNEALEQKKGVTGELDRMLKEANMDQTLIDSLAKGLRNLSDNTAKLADVSDAAVASQEYIKNVKNASTSVADLAHSYKKTAEALNQDAETAEEYFTNMRKATDSAASLAGAYNQAASHMNNELEATKVFAGSLRAATDQVNKLVDNYSKTSDLLTRSAEALDFSGLQGSTFNTELRKISDNMTALSAVFELQLQHTSQHADTTVKLHETMKRYLDNLNLSVDKSAEYQSSLDKLSKNVAALNQVYGNMLTAMNVNVK